MDANHVLDQFEHVLEPLRMDLSGLITTRWHTARTALITSRQDAAVAAPDRLVAVATDASMTRRRDLALATTPSSDSLYKFTLCIQHYVRESLRVYFPNDPH